MRHVKKDFEYPPTALQSQPVQDAIAALVSTGNRDVIQSDLYRGKTVLPDGTVRHEVVEALMLLYHDKCGYCETKEHDPQAEHYRPKGRVTVVPRHLGYFWLAFEWSNLLPTCFACNGIGKGKGNRFPLIGGEANRQSTPPFLPGNVLDTSRIRPDREPLSLERPYLLHPEIDQIELCFSFDNEGSISGIDTAGRGEKTIKICNLDRKNLRYRRQKALDVYTSVIKDTLLMLESGGLSDGQFLTFLNYTFERMKNWSNPAEEYSLFGKYVFENFPAIVLPLLPEQFRSTILEAFERFRTGQL